MRTRNPDARLRAIQAAQQAPTHTLERALWEFLRGEGTDETVAYAREIYSNTREREVLQAWFIARATNEEITRYLRVPVVVLDAYRHLFFDVTIFRDELDIMSWVREYEENEQGSELGVDLLQMAFKSGVDALAWLYGRGELVLDPMKVQQQIMTDAFMRGRAHSGNSLSSKEVAAAHGLYKTANAIAEKLAKKSTGAGFDDLLIKLRHRDLTAPVEEIPKDDLLH
jgi:hypothetical protein